MRNEISGKIWKFIQKVAPAGRHGIREGRGRCYRGIEGEYVRSVDMYSNVSGRWDQWENNGSGWEFRFSGILMEAGWGPNKPTCYWVVGFARAMFFGRWKHIGEWECLRRKRWEGSAGQMLKREMEQHHSTRIRAVGVDGCEMLKGEEGCRQQNDGGGGDRKGSWGGGGRGGTPSKRYQSY